MIDKASDLFTKREYQVFEKILQGLTAKQIGKALNLSPRTVEDYIENIKKKLHCSSKYHIAEAAIRVGMIRQY